MFFVLPFGFIAYLYFALLLAMPGYFCVWEELNEGGLSFVVGFPLHFPHQPHMVGNIPFPNLFPFSLLRLSICCATLPLFNLYLFQFFFRHGRIVFCRLFPNYLFATWA